jgi:hypothetical protein
MSPGGGCPPEPPHPLDGSRLALVRFSAGALVGLALFAVLALVVTDAGLGAVLIATLAVGVVMKIGFAVLVGFAQPVAEPPPAGELRKVRLTYRCGICSTEVRMTMANDEMPEPPRHCLDDMELVTPVDDL